MMQWSAGIHDKRANAGSALYPNSGVLCGCEAIPLYAARSECINAIWLAYCSE